MIINDNLFCKPSGRSDGAVKEMNAVAEKTVFTAATRKRRGIVVVVVVTTNGLYLIRTPQRKLS
jgi:hypothetical protein